jgi:hypothetical protein
MSAATRAAGRRTRHRAVLVIPSRVAFRITTKLHTRKTRAGTDRIGVAWRDVASLGRYARTLYLHPRWLMCASEHQWTAVPSSDVSLIVVERDCLTSPPVQRPIFNTPSLLVLSSPPIYAVLRSLNPWKHPCRVKGKTRRRSSTSVLMKIAPIGTSN